MPRASIVALCPFLAAALLPACLVRATTPVDVITADGATDTAADSSLREDAVPPTFVDVVVPDASANDGSVAIDVPPPLDVPVAEDVPLDAAPPDDVPPTDAGPPPHTASDVAMGVGFGCARSDDGLVRCWGSLPSTPGISRATTMAGLSDAAGVTAGMHHACAVRRTGGVMCWGQNSDGQLGDGTFLWHPEPRDVFGISDAVEVAAGTGSTCARLATGHVRCWGVNWRGQLGNGTTGPSPGYSVEVSGIDDATALTYAGSRGCVIRSDRSVWCWGANGNFEIGDGTTVDRPTPVRVSLPDRALAFTALRWSTIVVLRSGATWCWGTDTCGDADTRPRPTPAAVSAIRGVALLGLSEAFSLCFADSAGTPFCAGYSVGPSLEDSATPIPIALPEPARALGSTVRSTCAMGGTGRVYCWGENMGGEIGDGTMTRNGMPTLVAW